jgi:hypothetical protein
VLARGAVRGRGNDRLMSRKTKNAHIEKASYESSKDERKD